MIKSRVSIALVAFTAFALAGCAGEPAPRTETARSNLHSDVQSALRRMDAKDPDLASLRNSNMAYAIFPDVGKGGAIVGGAFGRGEVWQNGQLIGYAELQQASIGAQIGGQTYSELLIFKTDDALQRFKNNQFSFTANASAVGLTAGASKTAKFENGVAAFTLPRAGAMLEASVGGQRFTFQPATASEMTSGSVGPTTRPY